MENTEQSAAELSREERIESHFNTSNDHWNKYTFEIYNNVTESGLFEDVEVPLDAFSYATDLLWKGRKSPLSAVKILMSTFDKQDDPPFTDAHKRFILSHLIRYYQNTFFPDPNKKEIDLPQIATLLQKEKDKLAEPVEVRVAEYDWQATKQHLETLTNTNAKISYLIERKAAYKQSFSGWNIKDFGPEYDEQCQTEIKKLRDLAELERQEQTTPTPFKVSDKKGSKTNIIRVLSALYELNIIEMESGQRPTKEQFMQHIGSFIGVDMKHYEQVLSKALEQPLEANLVVFEELKAAIQKQVLSRLEKGRR